MKFLTSIDLLKNELQNAVIQPLAVAPADAVVGQIYFDTADKTLKQYDGEKWQAVGKEYTLPIAGQDTLGGIKVGAGLAINESGVLSVTGGGTADAVEWANILSKPTTIAGYGIVDAKIAGGVITLGTNTITPVVSVNGKTGGTIVLAASDVEALDLAGGTMTGAIAMGGNKITGLGAPEAETDATNKKYVDDKFSTVSAEAANTVKYTEQTLEEPQKVQARANIGAGTSNFDGNYNSLTNQPVVDTEMKSDSENAVQNKVIKAYVDNIVAASQGIVYKGVINVAGDIPTTYEVGWLYMIGTAGTYVGQKCEVGDLMIAVVARQGADNADSDWDIIQTNIDGAITELTGDDPISVTGTGSTREVAMNNSGVTVGGYGDTTDQTPAFGATIKVPSFTVDQYGRLTAAGEHMVTIPSAVATDTEAGLLSAADHKAFAGAVTDVTTLKTDVEELKAKDVTVVTTTITAGATNGTATVSATANLLSTMATNVNTGEQVIVETTISGTTFTASIAQAVAYDVKVVATLL